MLIANYCCCPPPGVPAGVTDITQGPVPWEFIPGGDLFFSLRAGSPFPWEMGGFIMDKIKDFGSMDGRLVIAGGASIGSFFPGKTVKNVYIRSKLTYGPSIYDGTFSGALTSVTAAPVFANIPIVAAAGVSAHVLVGDYENFNNQSPDYRFVVFGEERNDRFIDLRIEYIGVDFA